MASISESKLHEELQKKKTRFLYVFVGADYFKVDHYVEGLEKVLLQSGGSKEVLYGDELVPEALLDSVRTLSLWDPCKLLLIRQSERMTAKQWEALLPLLQMPQEKCSLVFHTTKADGRMKFFQALSKVGDDCVQVKLEPAVGGEWSAWLQTFAREAGKSIAPDARNLLQEWTSGSLSELKHTIDRAALFAGEEAEIRRDHVRAVGFRVTPEDIFRLVSGVLSGDRALALTMTETLLEQGEEPIAMVGLLARQYRWLLGILALRAEGKADAAIASELGIFPMAAKALFPASRRLGGKGVVKGLAALALADHSLKSSRLSREHVTTRLVLELT